MEIIHGTSWTYMYKKILYKPGTCFPMFCPEPLALVVLKAYKIILKITSWASLPGSVTRQAL